MVRLPNAKDPELQAWFRKLREIIPRMFSADEHKRYVKDLTTLKISRYYQSIFGERNGVACSYPNCNGVVHDAREYYEDLAEAIIGKVFLNANRLEEFKEELIELLLHGEHAALQRTRPQKDAPEFVACRVATREAERKSRQIV